MKRLFSIDADEFGDGKVLFEWSPRGELLACAGTKRKVCIFDRGGRLQEEISLPVVEIPVSTPKAPCCTALQWDPSSEVLALLPAGNTFIYLWHAASKELQRIETNFKAQELTALAWSRSSMLAVGTAKGNLLLYSSRERRKMPVVGKATKRIVAAVWNRDGRLALASADKTVTISDGLTGETIRTVDIKADPLDMCVAERKEDGARREENTYTIVTGKKTLYLFTVSNQASQGQLPAAGQPSGASERSLELAFQEHYGALVQHQWFGDGFIMLGFRAGQVVVVSSHSREIREEIHSDKMLASLSHMSYCPALNRMAIAGGNVVKVLDVGSRYEELRAEAVELTLSQTVESTGWSRDGQVLTVSTASGAVYSYLAALPVVYDTCGTQLLHMTSLLEMSLVDAPTRTLLHSIQTETEPHFCALGPQHAAVGINNQVWYYEGARLVAQRSYLDSVQQVHLNMEHAAVLREGRVSLHPLQVDPGRSFDEQDVVLPPPSQRADICCMDLTPHFLVTGTRSGLISCHAVAQQPVAVNEYRHEGGGILRLFAQPGGTRLVFQDEQQAVMMLNQVNDHVMLLPEFQGSLAGLLWDVADPNIFVAFDGEQTVYAYVYSPSTLSGPSITLLCKQSLYSMVPLVLSSGQLTCRCSSGTLESMSLDSHRAWQGNTLANKANLQSKFSQAIKMVHLRDAWECAVQLTSEEHWRQLGTAALEALDLPLATGAFRQARDASMVLSLEGLRGTEDRHLLAAHVMVLLERDHGAAQDLFLRSARPLAALEMRVDLKHWQQALALAQQLEPGSMAGICKEHAAMLEITGEYQQARSHYQQALEAAAQQVEHVAAPELLQACQAGLARCTLHMGDVRSGRQLALAVASPTLWRECALILEARGQQQEAASLYEKAGMLEKAAGIYIAAKNFTAAAPLMAQVSSPQLQRQYARAKEAEGRWAEAASAYEAAGDSDQVVRLCLDKLGEQQRAAALVRKSASPDAAALVARHCLQSSDYRGAVEFLLLARQMEQAFDVAQAHQEMDTFAALVAANAAPAELQRIAAYYESRGELAKAGDVWLRCGQQARAVQLYLQARTREALLSAIEVAGQVRSESVSCQVADAIQDVAEGQARDELRFRLNIALGQFVEAAHDAVELARFEQEEGNYKAAHAQLLATCRQLQQLGTRPPGEVMRALLLLHSYVLVKSLLALNDHEGAARMLVRVARSISRFPRHMVPILTSTVIECHRAGMRRSGLEYATLLMRPEYRNDVNAKYKRKIELMVRKPEKDPEEVEDELSACPFCQLPGPDTELQCVSCQNIIPFCIASGKRMRLDDWAQCPCCAFPARGERLLRLLAVEQRCPLCCQEVALGEVRSVQDPAAALAAWKY